jgi:hypothetical protein
MVRTVANTKAAPVANNDYWDAFYTSNPSTGASTPVAVGGPSTGWDTVIGGLSNISGFLTDPLSGSSFAQDYRTGLGKNLGNMSSEEIYNFMNLSNIDRMNAGPSLMDMGMGLLNAYNVWNQISMQKDYLDMAKEQLGMAKEQWQITKDEVNRIGKVRNNLNQGYRSGNYAPSPTSNTNY